MQRRMRGLDCSETRRLTLEPQTMQVVRRVATKFGNVCGKFLYLNSICLTRIPKTPLLPKNATVSCRGTRLTHPTGHGRIWTSKYGPSYGMVKTTFAGAFSMSFAGTPLTITTSLSSTSPGSELTLSFAGVEWFRCRSVEHD
jgi:hypothetical protein